MKTELYEDITTNVIMTFEDVKQQYADAKQSDLPIDDQTMQVIIMENLFQNGGNVRLINESENEIMKWCNDYAEYKEADRYLSQSERDESLKIIYRSIVLNDERFLKRIRQDLLDCSVAEGKALLERLSLLGEL